MYDLLFIVLFISAVIIMLISFENKNNAFWGTTLAFFSMFLFFTLALGTLTLETPYQIYNASSSQIETGTHVVDLANSGVNWVFLGFGMFMFIYGLIVLFGFITDKRDYV